MWCNLTLSGVSGVLVGCNLTLSGVSGVLVGCVVYCLSFIMYL